MNVKTKQHSLDQSRWEKLVSNKEFSISFRISSIGTSDFFDIKVAKNTVLPFTIESGQKMVFQLKNSDSVVVYNTTTSNSCVGCGAITLVGESKTGIEVSYMIKKEELDKLEKNSIANLLLYTTQKKIESPLNASEYAKILKAIIMTQDL